MEFFGHFLTHFFATNPSIAQENNQCIVLVGFWIISNMNMKIKAKVVQISSFVKYHEKQNQTFSDPFSCLSHEEPENLPGLLKSGPFN